MNYCHTLRTALRLRAKCHNFSLAKITKQLLSLCAYPKKNWSSLAGLWRACFEHSKEHHITHIVPLRQWEQGQSSPCQSTEFQHKGALLLDMAGLNILSYEMAVGLWAFSSFLCRSINAKCLQKKRWWKKRWFLVEFLTQYRKHGLWILPKLRGRSVSGRFWEEDQLQIRAKTLTDYVGRFLFSCPWEP